MIESVGDEGGAAAWDLQGLTARLDDLPEGRGAIPVIHDYLRACILDGRLAPGASISQVGLARRLGVSRTPLREALRMLQEEGFIEAATNQRARVAGFAAEQLDTDYACRILLESLALELTAPSIGPSEVEGLTVLLDRMRAAGAVNDTGTWFEHHTEFHRRLTRGAGDLLHRQIRSYADRSTRYIRVYQSAEPKTWSIPGDREHAAIVAALDGGDPALARATLAAHLARTALRVIADLAPEHEPVAVRRALAMAAPDGPPSFHAV